MNQAEFAHNLKAADTLRHTAERPEEVWYWTGYARGLRRSFHGAIFGTEEEHQHWMALEGDPTRDARRTGYVDGYRGLSVREAIREMELREDQAEARASRPDFYRGIQDAQDGEQP